MKCEIERMEINYTFYFFAFLKKVPYEKCDNCVRTAYQKAKEKCDNRKIQLEKKYKNMITAYESILFLMAWYSIATTLFTAILSLVFLKQTINCIYIRFLTTM